MAPKLKLKGLEIENGMPMTVVEKMVGEKSGIIYSTTKNLEYAGIKIEE